MLSDYLKYRVYVLPLGILVYCVLEGGQDAGGDTVSPSLSERTEHLESYFRVQRTWKNKPDVTTVWEGGQTLKCNWSWAGR
jgi:hypothetical protein